MGGGRVKANKQSILCSTSICIYFCVCARIRIRFCALSRKCIRILICICVCVCCIRIRICICVCVTHARSYATPATDTATARAIATATGGGRHTIVACGAWLAQKCFETEGELCRLNGERETERVRERCVRSNVHVIVAVGCNCRECSTLSWDLLCLTRISRMAFN